jgi:hypothetical protein
LNRSRERAALIRSALPELCVTNRSFQGRKGGLRPWKTSGPLKTCTLGLEPQHCRDRSREVPRH